MGQWTNAGFEARNLDYYKAAIQQIFIDAYGDDFLLDDSLPQGVLIQELAELFYGTDMDGVEAFARMNLNTATGVYLDLIGAMRGIPRSQGTPQMVTVSLTINPNNFMPFTIPEGHLFYSSGGDIFSLNNTTTINSAVGQTLGLSYTENGDSSVSIGDKMTTEEYNQITDIEVVSIIGGTEVETDMGYRNRLIAEFPVAGSTVQYVANKILELPTVKMVGVNYNDTSETAGGIAPYSTEWMAVPKSGADLTTFKNEVATTILNNKMPGAPTDGNTTVSAQDVFGSTKTVKFTIPTEVEIAIVCNVATPEQTGKLDLNRITAIKESVVNYVKTLDIGDDVSFSRCIAPFAADTGFDILSFTITDTDSTHSYTNANYVIGAREYATLDISNIEVTIGV